MIALIIVIISIVLIYCIYTYKFQFYTVPGGIQILYEKRGIVKGIIIYNNFNVKKWP